MSNTKIIKTRCTSKCPLDNNSSSDLSDVGIDIPESLAKNFIAEKYKIDVHGTEDADEVNYDTDTSTSFSLEECMKEFRARRFRRTSVPIRQEVIKYSLNKSNRDKGTADLDLINQNLCNKEQERKSKPCQNGFCYCFTSDSGDENFNLGGCHLSGNVPPRNSGRIKLSECIQCSKSGERSEKSALSQKKGQEFSPPIPKSSISKSTCLKRTSNRVKAKSTLETSSMDAPLIHMIQELRENCVVSKIKVNIHKLKSLTNNMSTKEKTTQINSNICKQGNAKQHELKQRRTFGKNAFNNFTPTAPILEIITDLEGTDSTNNTSSPTIEKNYRGFIRSERRHKDGGQLLQKRISNSQLNYKHRVINRAPPKPPRTLTYDKKYCEPTTLSASEAERVVDNCLLNKMLTVGYTTGKATKSIKTEHSCNNKKFERVQRNYTEIPNDYKKQCTIISASSYLSDIERVLDSTSMSLSVASSEAIINDMLKCNAATKQGPLQSTALEGVPQEFHSTNVVGNEKCIGRDIPHKVNLDTVDGIVQHNLASNLEYKNTPVKTQLTFPIQNGKEGSWQKFFLSKQLSHLSPWSNKYNINQTKGNKPNFNCASTAFIISSKKKLMRLVSPKKENKDGNSVKICKPIYRNVGVQTSYADLSGEQIVIHSQHSYSPQSPQNSYNSLMKPSHIQYLSSGRSGTSTPNKTELQFDFSRIVNSPPRRESRSSHKKLIFPLSCTFSCKENDPQNSDVFIPSKGSLQKRTYHSFKSDLDEDVTLSKISYILSNIRAKLEDSDGQAMRTFLESECIVDRNSIGFDCPDSHIKKRMGDHKELHIYTQPSRKKEDCFSDPIYSEIEDDNVHTTDIHDIDNQHFAASDHPDVLYTKVNKCTLTSNKLEFNEQQQPLAKIIHDSLKTKKLITNIPLPTLSERPGNESNSNSLPLPPLSHCQSLSNLRVIEQTSSPKKTHLSKSDLSLHRNDIYVESLCKNEMILQANFERENLKKIHNDNKSTGNRPHVSVVLPSSPNDVFSVSRKGEQGLSHNDTVSYELPNEEKFNDVDKLSYADNYLTDGNNLALSTIIPPSTNKQSTLKKQSFVAKGKSITSELNVDAETTNISNLYNICTNTPHKKQYIRTISQHNPPNPLSKYDAARKTNVNTVNALGGYESLKTLLHKSFRRSKTFIRNKKKRLSSLNFSMNTATVSPTSTPEKLSSIDSYFNLEALTSPTQSASLNDQIAKTVSICRSFPELEISMEMVEAERLLLFAALRRDNQLTLSSTAVEKHSMTQKSTMRFFIQDIILPILSDVNLDIFFNYFYIITFECGGIIKSTQSAKCVNGTAVFSGSEIELIHCAELEAFTLQKTEGNAVKCNIFMLRLRKISSVPIEQQKKTIFDTLGNTPSSTSTSSSSDNEVISRFRLHATFTLDAKDFLPYEYMHQESKNSDRICIQSSSFCTLPLTLRTKSTKLSGQLSLKASAEVRVSKSVFAGFLNVRDPNKQHSWNRRWCTLDGIFLYVWQDKNSLNTLPLLAVDLRDSKQNMSCPLACLPRELCARSRSFCLECKINNSCEALTTATVFFAADTLEILDNWLKNLNCVLDFIAKWF